MFCCLKFLYGRSKGSSNVAMRVNANAIQLDSAHMGHEVVLLKNGCRICGTGGVLATAPLVQSKSYFEVKLQQSGQWSIGLATCDADLNKSKGGTDSESWCLNSDHIVLHDNKEIHKLPMEDAKGTDAVENINDILPGTNNDTGIPCEGDTIGVTYDHVEINFYLNGKKLEVPVLGVRGNVYPALFVDDGAILDIILDNFSYGPTPGYQKIMLEKTLL